MYNNKQIKVVTRQIFIGTMNNNGIVDILGQMRTKFSKPLPSLTKMDSVLEASVSPTEKMESPNNTGPVHEDSDDLMEVEKELKPVSGAELDKFSADNTLCESEPFKDE